MKKWYTYTRNGIIYVQFKDRVTGKKLTAKSTKTRDPQEAESIINYWYYNQDSYFKKHQAKNNIALLKKILDDVTTEEFNNVLKTFFADKLNPNVFAFSSEQANLKNDLPTAIAYPPEIDEIASLTKTISFFDYLMLFWNYDKSPLVKQLARLGQKIPNPERFRLYAGVLKKYEHVFGNKLLTEINTNTINTMLGQIKNEGALRNSTIHTTRGIITQALKFAYKNKLLAYDLSQGVTNFTFKNRTKAIFSEAELKEMFSDKNYFGNTKYYLFNKILFKTGCRCGEIQALQINDLKENNGCFSLNISKSCRGGRIKETKTGRKDTIPISSELAKELLAFIEDLPYKANKNNFIFCDNKANGKKPIEYRNIYWNFKKVIKLLGIQKENLSLHSYRHTYATILWDKGFSELDLLYLTRHDDLTQIRRYGEHLTPAKEKKKVKASKIIDKIA